MTAAPPPRDSVLGALGYAFRILAKPGFLWAPILLYVVLGLPLLGLTGISGTPPTFTTAAEIEAYFRTFIPVFAATIVVGIIIGPIASAVSFRLARQYVQGEPPDPVGPGTGNLAWRFFLYGLAITGLVIVFVLACVIVFALLQAILPAALAVLIIVIGGLVIGVVVELRIALAPVLLLEGAGPVESIRRSWQITKGHLGRVFRWLFVTGLIIAIVSALIGGLIGAVLGALGLIAIGQLISTAVAAPFTVIQAIVVVLLLRVLTSPEAPARPEASLPEWMNRTTAAADTPGAPSDEPATPSTDGG